MYRYVSGQWEHVRGRYRVADVLKQCYRAAVQLVAKPPLMEDKGACSFGANGTKGT